jgi:hypothetical protein
MSDPLTREQVVALVQAGASDDEILEIARRQTPAAPTPAVSHETTAPESGPWYSTPAFEAGKHKLREGILGGGMVTAAPGAVSGGVNLLQGLGRRLYRGLLKPSKAVRQEFGDVVPGLITKRRLITKGGADAAETAVDQSAQVADDLIAAAAPTAAPIPPTDVIREFGDVVRATTDRVRAGVVPSSDLAKIGARSRRVVRTARTTQSGVGVDLPEAQRLKKASQEAATGAYRQMRAGHAKQLSTDDLLDAATARGYKSAIEARVPGVREQNAATQALIGESRALEDAVGRTGNQLPFGSVSDLAALSVGHLHPALGAAGKMSTMAGPGSAVAIGLNEAGRLPWDVMLRTAILSALHGNRQ